MAKTERLFDIIDFLRSRRSAGVAEIARRCAVGERTAYRDVLALAEGGVLNCRRGRCELKKDFRGPQIEITAEEREILLFALKENPLSSMPYFRALLEGLAGKLLSTDTSTVGVLKCGPLLIAPNSSKSDIHLPEGRIESLWRCLREGTVVSLQIERIGGRASHRLEALPLRLTWSGSKWRLDAIEVETGMPVTLDASRVTEARPKIRL